MHLSEGRGEIFFLDIFFHRMSEMEIFQQLSDIPDNRVVKAMFDT